MSRFSRKMCWTAAASSASSAVVPRPISSTVMSSPTWCSCRWSRAWVSCVRSPGTMGCRSWTVPVNPPRPAGPVTPVTRRTVERGSTICRSAGRCSLTSRLTSPGSAVSVMTAHPCSRAASSTSLRSTVFPTPLVPERSSALLGEPGPLRSASVNDSTMSVRPTGTLGEDPKVGVNGLVWFMMLSLLSFVS